MAYRTTAIFIYIVSCAAVSCAISDIALFPTGKIPKPPPPVGPEVRSSIPSSPSSSLTILIVLLLLLLLLALALRLSSFILLTQLRTTHNCNFRSASRVSPTQLCAAT